MQNSPELEAVHEPYTDVYYFSRERKSSRYGDASNPRKRGISSQTVNNSLRQAGNHKRLFVKELAFQGGPYVSTDLLEQGQHIFVTRKPQRVYQSLIKLKPDFSEDEFGFRALSDIHQKLTRLGKKVEIIDGDVFTQSPSTIVQNLCESIGVAFDPEMLHWKSGQIRKWDSHESESQAKWHKTLETSNTIIKKQAQDNAIDIAEHHQSCVQNAVAIYSEMLHQGQVLGESVVAT